MKIDTKYFGEVEIGDEKIIRFENGIPGFEDYKDYTIIYDAETDEAPLFSWLQSVDEKMLAFPVMNPFKVDENYNPKINDEMLEPIGGYSEDDLVVLLLATVPEQVKEASVNMKAPLIINASTKKGMQIILEGAEYEIKRRLIKE